LKLSDLHEGVPSLSWNVAELRIMEGTTRVDYRLCNFERVLTFGADFSLG